MYRHPRTYACIRCGGFTLVELVVGMVVMAVALTLLSVTFFSSPGRAIDPMMQARAAEFGQALLEEMLSKRFDELSPIGGQPPCSACSATMGPETGETRKTYDDVDDYNVYCVNGGTNLVDIMDNTPDEFSSRFKMKVCVTYASGFTNNLKRIQVDMLPPGAGGPQSAITLVAYRGNY